MKDEIFAVIQLPFADFRRFIPEPPNLVSRPSWPSPSSNEFVRNFGGVCSRKFNHTSKNDQSFIESAFPTERHYIDASWHIIREQNKLISDRLSGVGQVQFLRLIGDQQAVVRFEIGIRFKADPKLWHNIHRIEEVLRYLSGKKIFRMRTGVDQEQSTKGIEKPINLNSLSSVLRRKYYVASALHDGSGVRPDFNGRYLKPLDCSIFVELPTNKSFRWLKEVSILRHDQHEVDIALLRSPDAREGNARLSASFAIAGNHSSRSRENVRRLRIHYLRMRAELQALWQVLSELRTGGLLERYTSDEHSLKQLRAELCYYLERSVNRVSDTLAADRSLVGDHRLLEVLWAEDLVSDSFLETLAWRTHQLLGSGLSSRVVASLTRDSGTTNVFFGGSHTVGGRTMSKYEFKGPVTGAVGDGARATDFVVNLSSGTADQADLNVLAEELLKLINHIKGEHNGEAQSKSAIASLEEAKSAAEKGDQRSVLPALKAAAAWCLEKATAIGIPVAVAALKKSLGL